MIAKKSPSRIVFILLLLGTPKLGGDSLSGWQRTDPGSITEGRHTTPGPRSYTLDCRECCRFDCSF